MGCFVGSCSCLSASSSCRMMRADSFCGSLNKSGFLMKLATNQPSLFGWFCMCCTHPIVHCRLFFVQEAIHSETTRTFIVQHSVLRKVLYGDECEQSMLSYVMTCLSLLFWLVILSKTTTTTTTQSTQHFFGLNACLI